MLTRYSGLSLVVFVAVTCLSALAAEPALRLLSADTAAVAAHGKALDAVMRSRLPDSDDGLIGRNKRWGGLYSPRFQMGAGHSLRLALAANNSAAAQRAFLAIDVATAAIDEHGYVASRLPKHMNAKPSAANIASAAAFFLGDACLAMAALDTTARTDIAIDATRRKVARERLLLAIRWLATQTDKLQAVDAKAPNRLLFNARAFYACGVLINDEETQPFEALTAAFVDAALAQLDASGYFVESGSWDTSYQGVAIGLGETLLSAGYEDPALTAAMDNAAVWLAARVDDKGRVDSSGNTRTCWGQEQFLGDSKKLSVSELFVALAYHAARTDQEPVRSAAQRVAARALRYPAEDPCFR